MNKLKTLRHELEKEIFKQQYSLSQFSKVSGVNRGILSSTLNCNSCKPISMNPLDLMGRALNMNKK